MSLFGPLGVAWNIEETGHILHPFCYLNLLHKERLESELLIPIFQRILIRTEYANHLFPMNQNKMQDIMFCVKGGIEKTVRNLGEGSFSFSPLGAGHPNAEDQPAEK